MRKIHRQRLILFLITLLCISVMLNAVGHRADAFSLKPPAQTFTLNGDSLVTLIPVHRLYGNHYSKPLRWKTTVPVVSMLIGSNFGPNQKPIGRLLFPGLIISLFFVFYQISRTCLECDPPFLMKSSRI